MIKALKQALEDFKAALRNGEEARSSEIEDSTRPQTPPESPQEDKNALVPHVEVVSVERSGPDRQSSLQSEPLAQAPAVQETLAEITLSKAGKKPGIRRISLLALSVGIAWFASQNVGNWLWPEPADKNIVAIYAGGSVTKEELLASVESHSESERRALTSKDGLHALVQDIVVHRVVERWAKEKQLDEKDSVQHAMRHTAEEINLRDIGTQLHQGQIRVDEADVVKYYEENRERLGNRPLAEVRDSIREMLHQGKENEYIDNYLRDLRERASVAIDYELLKTPQPTENDLLAYYQSRQAEFRESERVRVQEIRFRLGSGVEESEVTLRADRALARVKAGEDFAQTAQQIAAAGSASTQADIGEVERGIRSREFDETVFALREGEVSPVFKDEDSYVLVKVIEKRRDHVKTFEEVRDGIRNILRAENAIRADEENKAKTLFTIQGRRFTLGEFMDEYRQLSSEVQARYKDFEGKKLLVDRLIERLLVLDTASNQMLDVKNQKEIDDARRHVLAEYLHQEEMQDRVQVNDDEVKKFYEQHLSHYTEPLKIKISYIRVGMGSTDDDRRRAKDRIDQAARMLQATNSSQAAFAEVAKEFSEDPGTAAKGGDMEGWLARSDDVLSHAVAHDFAEEVFRLKVGDTSRVVILGDSYFIVRVREKEEAKALAFEQVKEMVREDLLTEKHFGALQDMQAELSRRMQLVIYDRRLQPLADEIQGKEIRPR